MSRPLTATVTSPTGTPLEGELLVLFGNPSVQGVTDAGGGVVLTVEVEAEQVEPYTLSIHAPIRIDGALYLPGTVLRLDVPDGEGPLTLVACIVEVVDASPAALLGRIAALEALMPGGGA